MVAIEAEEDNARGQCDGNRDGETHQPPFTTLYLTRPERGLCAACTFASGLGQKGHMKCDSIVHLWEKPTKLHREDELPCVPLS